ncbi:MAG: LuxR C-terminal-related transcriptional regulator [Clostridiaceae bacterium]
MKLKNNRSRSTFVFMLFSAWLVSFPYEGQVLYALFGRYGVNPAPGVFNAIIAQLLGLISCMFIVKSLPDAKRMLLVSTSVCLAGSVLFFFHVPNILRVALLVISFVSGFFIPAWGFFYREYTPSGERMSTVAKALAYSSLIMIPINLCAAYFSAHLALLVDVALLVLVLWEIQALDAPAKPGDRELRRLEHVSLPLLLITLCGFILVLSINSGLMFQVIMPAFSDAGVITDIYWAVPYIAAILLINRFGVRANQPYLLYVSISMLGLSFVAFSAFPNTIWSYLLIDTLLLGACGINDLFWWSILGEMLDFDKNPARTLGIGLGANVAGVIAGKFIGAAPVFSHSTDAPTRLGMAMVCLAMLFLPLLHRQLSLVIRKNTFLVSLSSMPPEQQQEAVNRIGVGTGLSERESEIAMLLLKGYPYKLIASKLYISESTVKSHVQNIYGKLGIHSRTELIEEFSTDGGSSFLPK